MYLIRNRISNYFFTPKNMEKYFKYNLNYFKEQI